MRTIIVGAGIGGLTAALACLHCGIDVEVYEQAPAFAEVGAGVQISANGSRVLLALGLESALKSLWVEPTGKEIRLWNTGETWKLFDLGVVSRERYGAPYFMIHRADLHRTLIDAVAALKSDAVRLNSRYLTFEQDESGVKITLEDGTSVRGDVLIGADGVHSQIRNQLTGTDRPHFTGCLAWRGLIRSSLLPPNFARPVGTNWVGSGGHVVTYPVRGLESFNFVGIIERNDWQVESWTARGTHEECAADFEGWHPDIHEIIRNIEVPYKWALLGRQPLTRWSFGRATLLGDAAHPTLPMLAQGANMAIEDGAVLAQCLSENASVGQALSRYEDFRIGRTTRLVNGALDNAKRFHNPALANGAGAKKYVEDEWQEDKVKQRYDWIFEYDATRAEEAPRMSGMTAAMYRS
ncbi:FAD-dependent monooxygenase [Bradyrhizobium manausense]|uniref:FAD-dependent monooxygenase n=1 Tax=Bradyrhizobium manausense TaxID=989370 RepID=UPI001BAD0AE9|nr:FAD-dependent monooxygenase [Bradyrhizobium manausense]MBR0687769.1 FAD-dependent monooxygenase [Bradyrhizobium manausense]